MTNLNKAVFIIGPTACGKTQIALNLAKLLPCEIISVDSALIYQGLNLGSAKPSLTQLAAVPHHLIDIRSPLENYSVADFVQESAALVSAINQRGCLPLLVGGTMMYFNALIKGLSNLPAANPELRLQFATAIEESGLSGLYNKLRILDPESAAKIGPTDSQRIQRALEVCTLSGQTLGELYQQAPQHSGLSNCNYLALGIMAQNRQLLHQRINQRLVEMVNQGFIEEVQALRKSYPMLSSEHNSMRCVGYRQVWEYLDGFYDKTTMLNKAQAATRQLAKRQCTWLRSLPLVMVDDPDLDSARLCNTIMDQIQQYSAHFCHWDIS